jgi:hemerythrin-like domain-containing protein
MDDPWAAFLWICAGGHLIRTFGETTRIGKELSMKAMGLLKEEHRHILRALNIIEGMAARLENGEMPDAKDVELVLKFLQCYGDYYHQEREESVLFPALLKASRSDEYEDLCTCTFEHNRERSLIEGVRESLMTRKGSDFIYYTRRLIELMRAHIQSEEEGIFRRADELLDEKVDELLIQELARYDSPNQAWKLATLECLTALEARYITPPKAVTEKTHSVL